MVHTAFYKQYMRQNVEYDVVQFLIEVLNSTFRDGKGPYSREQMSESTDLSTNERMLFEKEIRGMFHIIKSALTSSSENDKN